MNNLQAKQAIVRDLVTKLHNKHFYITNSEGLNVEQVNDLRRLCRQKEIHYQVIKNTLLQRVLSLLTNQTIDYAPLKEKALKGATAIFITERTPSEPAKLIQEFHKTKKSDKPLLKGAIVNGEIYLGLASLETLSKIKTREVLIAELISLLQSPTHRVLKALKSTESKLSGIMKALSK